MSLLQKAKIVPFVFLLLLPLGGMAAPQAGGESDEGKGAMAAEAFQTGQALYKNGEYLEAAHQFEKAYRLTPHPSVLANIGYCYNKIGDYPKAVKALRGYLEQPDPQEEKRNQKIEKYLEEMKSKVGDLRVSCPAARCEVAVDGSSHGMTPTTILLRAGGHTVEVTPIDGGQERRYTVNVPGGGELVLNVDLSDSFSASQKLDRSTSDTSPLTQRVGAPPADPRTGTGKTRLRVPFWVATGTAISGAVATGVLIGVGYKTRRDFFDGGSTDKDLKHRGENLVVGINVAAGLTAAAATTAVILAIIEFRKKRDRGGERSHATFRREKLSLRFSPGVFTSLQIDF